MKKMRLFILYSVFIYSGFLFSKETHLESTDEKKGIHEQQETSNHYELTMCCITRDEEEYLPEWIEFHLKQGIEHFYIYDNLTKNNLNDVLVEYVQKGLVDIVSWPYEHHDKPSWVQIQFAAYKDYIKHHQMETEWCAFIDTDEFLFCPGGKSLREFLNDYKAYQAVMVCWLIYGTSNVWQAPKGQLIQTLFYRAPDHHNLAMKPIVKVRYVSDIFTSHYFHMNDPAKIVDENFNHISDNIESFCPKVLSVNKIRINHYVFRDRKFFEAVKIPRYIKRGNFTIDGILEDEAKMNVVYDDCILQSISY